MKALKWIAIGVGGLAALAGVAVAAVFMLTAGASDAAEQFLARIGRGQYEEAYRSTTPQFQAQTSFETFRATMQRYKIDAYDSASWNSREISGGRATLEGTIRTRGGGNVSARISLVEIGDAWKVEGLHLKAAGITERQTGSAAPAAPDTATARKLALRSLADFNEAVRRGDFSAFHATLARPFRAKYSPAQLKTIFKAFVESKIDLKPIEQLDPVFTRGPGLEGGTLELAGYFATRPSQVHFELSYVMEDGAWRLTGINVRVARA
ncbi:MAG TPA: hypothetical protein VIF14_03905 [Alphaproteobacteria bacterium]|jgi:hypothetical protein